MNGAGDANYWTEPATAGTTATAAAAATAAPAAAAAPAPAPPAPAAANAAVPAPYQPPRYLFPPSPAGHAYGGAGGHYTGACLCSAEGK